MYPSLSNRWFLAMITKAIPVDVIQLLNMDRATMTSIFAKMQSVHCYWYGLRY